MPPPNDVHKLVFDYRKNEPKPVTLEALQTALNAADDVERKLGEKDNVRPPRLPSIHPPAAAEKDATVRRVRADANDAVPRLPAPRSTMAARRCTCSARTRA